MISLALWDAAGVLLIMLLALWLEKPKCYRCGSRRRRALYWVGLIFCGSCDVVLWKRP